MPLRFYSVRGCPDVGGRRYRGFKSRCERSSHLAVSDTWLPASEQFGEGLFIHFESDAIIRWLNEKAAGRHQQLRNGYSRWATRFGARAPKYPSTPYVLLHSLSHALMTEIALDCGYPASSLKERVYALGQSGTERCGLLIYTATAGAQGTLGGLVGTAPRFAEILRAALEHFPLNSVRTRRRRSSWRILSG